MVEIRTNTDVIIHLSFAEIVEATGRRAFDVVTLCFACLDELKSEYLKNLQAHRDILRRGELQKGEQDAITLSNEAIQWQKDCISALSKIDSEIESAKVFLMDTALSSIENYHRLRGFKGEVDWKELTPNPKER